MIRPGQALRLIYIGWVLLKNGLDELVFAIPVFRPFIFLRYFSPGHWMSRHRPRGERVRRALEELGPIFVKFGQILSTRRDLLAPSIIDELSKLQDRVPPFPGSVAQKIIEDAYRKPVSEVFTEFDVTPMASASIAQVHAATLQDGRKVVVKVVRPDIAPVIKRDIGLLYIFAGLLQRYWSEGKRLRPVEVVGEFEKTILDELDLMREAANASQLRRNFPGSPLIYIPEVYWPLTRRNVMVMERISGIPIANVSAIRAAGIDLKQLAERGVEIFFTQVFRHNFFHADMHPGNIFVAPDGQYIAVDFGIVGSLSEEDKFYLAQNFLAFFKRDYYRVAQLHVESGWVPEGTRVDEFESAIRTVCEPIFERPLAEISFGQLLLRLFQTARRFQMEVQPQLVLLQKTLLNIEGLGRQLYPDLDLWKTAKPFLERWMDEQVGARAVLKRFRASLPQYAEKIPELPLLLHEVLTKAAQGKLRSDRNPDELARLREEMRRGHQRHFSAIVGGSLLLSAAVIFTFHGAGAPFFAWALALLGALVWTLTWPRERE